MKYFYSNNHVFDLSAIFSLCGPAVFIFADVFAISISTNYNPVYQSISDLMLTPYGWIEKLGIIAITIPLLLLFFQYSFSRDREQKEKYVTGFLLGLTAICFILIITFDTDPGGFNSTLRGRIHIIAAALVSILIPVTCFLMAAAWKKSAKSTVLVVYAIATGLFGISEMFRALNFFDIPQGLCQRSLTLVNLVWIGALGIHSRLGEIDSRRV